MARFHTSLVPVLASVLFLGACAGDGPSMFQTASVTAPVAEEAPKSKVSQACVELATQIQTLRNEGSVERLEKVATGKGDNVQVKRTAIAKQAELNKANADFQAKCGPRIPTSTQAAAPAAAPVVAAAATATAAKAAPKAAAAALSGVTIAPSAAKTQ